MREIDNEARTSKKSEMKRKFNRNQKRITPLDIQLTSLIFLVRLTAENFIRKIWSILKEDTYLSKVAILQ